MPNTVPGNERADGFHRPRNGGRNRGGEAEAFCHVRGNAAHHIGEGQLSAEGPEAAKDGYRVHAMRVEGSGAVQILATYMQNPDASRG